MQKRWGVLPFTFVTTLIIKSDPTFLTQTSNSYVFRFKNRRPNHFFSQTGIDLPNSPIELFDKFEILLGKFEVQNIESNILGDINCDMLAISPTNKTRHLIELCESYQYTQLIKKPTRITSSSNHLLTYFLPMSRTNLLHQACLILAVAITV